MTRAYDEYWDDEPTIETLPGSGSETEDRSLDGLVLELIADLTRLHVLLSEATEEEFTRLQRRLVKMRHAFLTLPQHCQNPRRVVGFQPKAKRGKK